MHMQEFFARWGQQGTVDLKQELEQVLMLITARCLLGKEVRERMLHEVFSAYRDLTENSLHLTSLLFPYAPTPAARRRDRARATLSGIFSEIVRSRRRSGRRAGDDDGDVLQSLVDARYRDGRGTTEAEVTGLVIAILFAGKHTSSATSTWTGARLLRHAECLDAAVDEQRRVVAERGSGVDYDALAEMGFLHCCIKEALRMHPTAPLFLRRAHRGFTVRTREGAEYDVPSGQTVASPLLINHYIPYVYRDPHVYDPRRFGPGREEDRVGGRFCYNAFSGGRHACPGEAYAYMQVKVIWSHLLRNFELKLVSPFPRTDWMKLSPEARGKVVVSYKRRMVPVGSVLEN
jgi:sterol 14alpha-demethylase|uniref:Obtusifoliol 14-alpha demethylase n=1 Tax=Zea mays TaxID=4577 RepID=C4J202_MAIZE|nr:unknown [Zea mays]